MKVLSSHRLYFKKGDIVTIDALYQHMHEVEQHFEKTKDEYTPHFDDIDCSNFNVCVKDMKCMVVFYK